MLLLSFAAAQAAGAVADRLRIPGGPIFVGLIATASISLTFGDVPAPPPVTFALVIVLAVVLGVRMTKENLRALRRIAVPSLLAASILLVAGLGVGLLVRALAIAPHGDLLATTPAALSIIGAVAVEHGFDPAGIAVFHVMRIMLVIVTLPLLIRMLSEGPGRAGHPRTMPGHPGPTSLSEVGPRDAAEPLARGAGWRGFGLLGLALLISTAVGLLTQWAALPIPLLLPPFIVVSAIALVVHDPIPRPRWLAIGVQAGFGWLLGTFITRDTFADLGPVAAGAALSSVLLILVGIGTAMLLARLGIGPRGEMLATSPGGLEALVLIADERGVGPMEVTLYHTVRMLVVMVALPLIVLLAR